MKISTTFLKALSVIFTLCGLSNIALACDYYNGQVATPGIEPIAVANYPGQLSRITAYTAVSGVSCWVIYDKISVQQRMLVPTTGISGPWVIENLPTTGTAGATSVWTLQIGTGVQCTYPIHGWYHREIGPIPAFWGEEAGAGDCVHSTSFEFTF